MTFERKNSGTGSANKKYDLLDRNLFYGLWMMEINHANEFADLKL